jgi:hypothetical protein
MLQTGHNSNNHKKDIVWLLAVVSGQSQTVLFRNLHVPPDVDYPAAVTDAWTIKKNKAAPSCAICSDNPFRLR